MRMRDTLTMAFVAIARNKVRSVLTALGIGIGVARVIAMVHLGQAATLSVTESISSMGSNLLIVQTGRGRGRGGVSGAATAFTHEDVELMARQIPGVLVAPQANTQATLVYGGINHSASV